jgi:RNA polymerase sigma-70 factor (ECF subfamily)
MVFGTAWRILGDAPDAEDVVQDVFLEIHRLYQERAVRHWGGLLRRLAACRAVDRLRRRKKTVGLNGLCLLSTSEDPEASAIERELAGRLRDGLAQLPEREAAVFSLRYFEDLSYREIAKSLDISPAAVAVALHKARAKLEAMLTEAHKGEEP